ncbi:unnamed protein product [Bursaphelenchus xylophilus]|uniref:(pine wood nematode) hypothetical protein n=1 Tax=Bursaphelenchus xylophilus TaxID=6326 RepID=A0A7I8X8K0_BURXY|nr:unnamed protein product [Bursaphelenchus xylophilus]CAG9126347.1 unnamed protein product [Bursaphelenchus xylophilus]
MGSGFVLLLVIASYLCSTYCDAQCTGSLGPCIGGECPDHADAGGLYTCINDLCCPQSPTASNCIDGAINCQMFLSYCRQQPYVWCMASHCAQSCRYCM